ncbi:MAG: site-2 protease family protein [Oculatellaceae cyanobacterium Prado106]|jgi:membrane-associated protease RseP (regulator of RpoE activity)|nr:site-2 protease family protein [Oculatellaceae cyanobacterium Prado106]
MLFWLLLLGILTYFIVRRSVADITRTPIWILWLVMMLPVFIWTGWMLIKGESEPIPPLLLLGPFVACPVLYWFLVQLGRPVQTDTAQQTRMEPRREALAIAPEKKNIPRPISREEEEALKNCFPWSLYYLQNIEYRPQAMICRGQLRGKPDLAYRTINGNIKEHFGDRFLLVFQEDRQGKPFFALVPNPLVKTAANPTAGDFRLRPVLAIGLLLATLLTTCLAGYAILNPIDPANPTSQQAPDNLAQLLTGLPYAFSLLAILGVHEMGHFFATQRYRIRATLPYFIPVPPATIFPFGTFGAFIQIRSPIPNRKALFDIGIAGPLAGFIIAVPILLWGLAHSTPIPLQETSSLLNPNSFRPTGSLLLTLFSKAALGAQLSLDQALKLHPMAIAGCLGVIITALNLMPVGQLDGGHIVHAMFGQRNGARIGQIARFLVLALGLVQREFLVWAVLLFLMPVVDEPALNDVSELDNKRDFLGLLALGLLVIIVLPAPELLTRFLF